MEEKLGVGKFLESFLRNDCDVRPVKVTESILKTAVVTRRELGSAYREEILSISRHMC